MNKADFTAALAADMGTTQKEAAAFIDRYHDLVGKTLAKGESIAFVGFGNYEVRKRPARTARNPRSGETIELAAKSVPAFRPGKGLKDLVNQG